MSAVTVTGCGRGNNMPLPEKEKYEDGDVWEKDFWRDMNEKKNPTGRGWVFTINNPNKDDKAALDRMKDNKDVVYMCYQYEKGKSGTPHFQGWLHTKSVRWGRVRLDLGGRAWVKPKLGSHEQCEKYCTKAPRIDGPWRIGVLKEEGKQSLISKLAEDLKNGVKLDDIAVSDPLTYMLHHRKAKALGDALNNKKVNILVGKEISRVKCLDYKEAVDYCKNAKIDASQIYVKDKSRWWDNYEDEKIVICWVNMEEEWKTGFPFRIEFKNGSRMVVGPDIWLLIADAKKIKKLNVVDEGVVDALMSDWDTSGFGGEIKSDL